MTTGCSRRSAALSLQIPLGSLHSATISIQTWQKEPGNAAAYQSALHRVAEIVMAEASPSWMPSGELAQGGRRRRGGP